MLSDESSDMQTVIDYITAIQASPTLPPLPQLETLQGHHSVTLQETRGGTQVLF